MAIYVYTTATGALVSYIPDSLTIAQAQANHQLAPNATLAANGLTAIDGLPPLGPTVAWDPVNKTTQTVTAPVPAAPMPTFFFISRFTAAEWGALRTAVATDQTVAQFLDGIGATNIIDLTEPLIQQFGTYAVSHGFLTSGRANTILTTPFIRTSLTG